MGQRNDSLLEQISQLRAKDLLGEELQSSSLKFTLERELLGICYIIDCLQL